MLFENVSMLCSHEQDKKEYRKISPKNENRNDLARQNNGFSGAGFCKIGMEIIQLQQYILFSFQVL